MSESNHLDLVFCCDCTSSMSSYIESAKTNIRKISEKLLAMEAKNMRYGLVCYRDHPPEDSTYATKTFPLTPSLSTMQSYVDTMTAAGGGDGPESVACALHEALNADWRKDAVKVCVIIADAPPHGIGGNGDGFPNGCPCGFDPLKVAKEMAERNIIIYSVAVEPSLGQYTNGRAFFKGIAKLTHGRYLDLGQAQLLPDVIVGGSAEELDLKRVEDEIEFEYNKIKSETPTLGTEAVKEAVHKNLASKGVRTWHLDVTEQDAYIENESIFFESDCLETAKSKVSGPAPARPTAAASSTSIFDSIKSFTSGLFGGSAAEIENRTSMLFDDDDCGSTYDIVSAPMPSPLPHTRSYTSQEAKVYQDTISLDQVDRIMSKNKHS